MDMTPRTFSDSVLIDASPDQVYALVSDVTRTGEWSPVCKECTWKDGDGPQVGARFLGHNDNGERAWDTLSTVIAADPGREFAWEVGRGYVRWGYLIEPAGDGSRLTETWEFTTAGLEFYREGFGERAAAEADAATQTAHDGIAATLAAIRRILESSAG